MASGVQAAARSSVSRRSMSSLSTTSASLSHTISNIENSKPAIVMDIGTKLTKLGFAGDFVPRVIIRTQFLDNKNVMRNGLNSSNDHGQSVPNLAYVLNFFKAVFYKHLTMMPRERRVVIVESFLCPTEMKQTICKALMDILDVPSVLFIPGHLCATFPFNTDNALVIDVGYKEVQLLPIVSGVSMLSCWEISPCGSRQLEERVLSLMKDHGYIESTDGLRRALTESDVKAIDDQNLVEDICVRHLFCTDFVRAQTIQRDITTIMDPPTKESKLLFNGEQLVVTGIVREAACEVFFESVDASSDDVSLPQIIHRLVMKLPIDLRRQAFENLLVVGGPSLIPGFLSRLKAEIAAIAAEQGITWCKTIKFYQFGGQYVQLYAGWLGGSMFGSLSDVLQLRSVSRDLWQSTGVVPDWTDYVQNNLPCGKNDMTQ